MERWGHHQAIWNLDAKKKSFDCLRQDLSAEVCIVGAGITGLTAAVLLAKAGRNVVLLTGGEVGEGTTGFSTGHLTQVLDMSLGDLVSNFGINDARQIMKASETAIETVDKLSREFSIECGFQRVHGFKFTEDKEKVPVLENEVEVARGLGLEAAMMMDNPLPFETAGAARFENQAQFHPLKYVYGLAQTFQKLGGQIFEYSRVFEVKDGEPCLVTTEHGSVKARHLILATHSPVGVYISLHTRVAPYFSYVLAVKLNRAPEYGIYWDMSDPYYYLRPFSPESNLWIIGGRDHKTGQESNNLSRYLELENYIRERLDVHSMVSYWGSELFESVDGLPYIGKIPFTANIFTGTGYAGTGLTFGTLAGEILSDEILGRRNPFASLFDPLRVKPMASAGSFIKENANVARWLVTDRMTRVELKEIKNIPPSEGRLVEIGGKKIAIYRDENSRFQALSPTCTHMGCTVHWNNAEKTWDCPCHGGRYTAQGEVFSGPPLASLESIPMRALPTEEKEAEPVPAYGQGVPLLPEQPGFDF